VGCELERGLTGLARYDAIRAWYGLLTSADSEYWVQLTPGTVLSVDNHRVLHGRSAFEGKRRVCGAYIGVDEYRSRLGSDVKSVTSGSLFETDAVRARLKLNPSRLQEQIFAFTVTNQVVDNAQEIGLPL
jgi:hypothetical protein